MQWPKGPTTQHPRKGTIHIPSLHVCLYADLSPGKDKLEMHPHFGKTNQLMDVYNVTEKNLAEYSASEKAQWREYAETSAQ